MRGCLKLQRLHLAWPACLIVPPHCRDQCIRLIFFFHLVRCAEPLNRVRRRQRVFGDAQARSTHAYFGTLPTRGWRLGLVCPFSAMHPIAFLILRLERDELANPPQKGSQMGPNERESGAGNISLGELIVNFEMWRCGGTGSAQQQGACRAGSLGSPGNHRSSLGCQQHISDGFAGNGLSAC